MTEKFTAKSVDEAKELAAKKFGVSVNKIKFEVLEEGKKGLFGLGSKDAVVKATFAAEAKPVVKAETPAATAPVKKEEPVTAAPVVEETVSVPTTETTAEPVAAAEETAEIIEEKAEEVSAAIEEKAETKKENFTEDDEEDYSLDNFTLIEDEALIDAKVKLAMDYIRSIFRAMDVDVNFTVYQNETGAVLNLESDSNGAIIGKRGETLDAIQYLCSIIANKGDKDYFRITIDCLGYRSKRKDTLEQLAAKIAKSVLRTGRSQPLEPMNPYERRVIHSAISKIEGVSSRSVGEEPYRKIIISSLNPKPNGRRRDNRDNRKRGDNRRRNGGNRNNRENRDREVKMERRSVDLSTSFEKDYRKPKPEDTMEGGLYGKIEL